MDTIEQLLNKLSQIKWTDGDNKTLSNDEWKCSLSTEFLNHLHAKDYRVQVVVRIKYNGTHAFTWGCSDNSENSKVVEWFIRTKADTLDRQFDRDRKHRDLAKIKFTLL